MKLAVFGRHPVPQPGFNGVMSLYESKWFSLLGHEVDLLIPFTDKKHFRQFLEKHHLQSLDELDRFGGDFVIRPVYASEETFGNFDTLIYQSYDPADWAQFAETCRRSAKLLTKNFPKFVSGIGYQDDVGVVNQFKTFDLIACALQDDITDLKSCREFYAAHEHQVAYVGRGADEDLLHPARKIGRTAVLGLDVPVGNDFRAVEHYIRAIDCLRNRGLELDILTLGREIPGLEARRIPYGRFDRVYDAFFNEVWIYCVINYAFSPAHVTSSVQKTHPKDWTARAVFEVQNVEAQMSGAALLAHESNVIRELFDPGASGFLYPDFDDVDDIADRIAYIVQHYDTIRVQARRWAMASYRWCDCIARWEHALLNLLN